MKGFSRFLKQLGLMAAIVLLGTLIDWAVHSSRPEFFVPAEYYRNKILFGTAWGMIGYWGLRFILRVSSPRAMAIGISAIIALVLQTRYFYESYGTFFVFLFLLLHFLMFLPFSLIVFKKWPHIFMEQKKEPRWSLKRRWLAFVGVIIAVEVLFFLYFQVYLGLQRL